jgi:hypothetical protein
MMSESDKLKVLVPAKPTATDLVILLDELNRPKHDHLKADALTVQYVNRATRAVCHAIEKYVEEKMLRPLDE